MLEGGSGVGGYILDGCEHCGKTQTSRAHKTEDERGASESNHLRRQGELHKV